MESNNARTAIAIAATLVSLGCAPAARSAPQQSAPSPQNQNKPAPASPPTAPPANQPAKRNQPAENSVGATDENSSSKTMGSPPELDPRFFQNRRFPGNITIRDWRLALNGIGVHTEWFFFDKYIAALYLTNLTHVAAGAVSGKGARAIRLTMLTDENSDAFTDALQGTFKASLPDAQQGAAMRKKWQKFVSLFPDLDTDDVVMIAYIPQRGTDVSVNKQLRGTVKGKSFARAVLGMWLGDNPIDGKLKDQLLGEQL